MATKLERRLKAIENARLRRRNRASSKEVNIRWFIDEVTNTIDLTMAKRVKIATELVKSKVVVNIGRPVTKTVVTYPVKFITKTGKITTKKLQKTVVTNRSKPGEFPKAETTQLMKTIFGVTKQPTPGVFMGFVGTPLDYGLRLEVDKRLDRSFLRRTFESERHRVFEVLTGPIKGVENQATDFFA